jgi:arylsulfatase A-like enzyme
MDVHIPYYPHEGTVSAGINSRRATKVYHKARKSPEEITDDEKRLLQRLYRGEVKRLDTRIGDLLDRLDRRMPMDDTYIVFASDHGEAFGEHDSFFHGGKLHQELIHVPLIVSKPGIDRKVVDAPVSNLDIMPTLLEVADVDVPGECDGDPVHTGVVPDDRAVFAEAYSPSMGRMMAYDGRWKYVETRSSGQQALFDLETDAGEQRNLFDSRTEELHRLRRMADDHRESVLSEEPRNERRRIEVSEVAKHRLRRLGYDE